MATNNTYCDQYGNQSNGQPNTHPSGNQYPPNQYPSHQYPPNQYPPNQYPPQGPSPHYDTRCYNYQGPPPPHYHYGPPAGPPPDVVERKVLGGVAGGVLGFCVLGPVGAVVGSAAGATVTR
mmetsp:Transcript_37299/g.52652  ORF Transcript_37299/g.52652 Transcript_37299/m.52652 type:complete len:121 (+) Transcript_37299:224-586(+)